jgi:hypothetical protein
MTRRFPSAGRRSVCPGTRTRSPRQGAPPAPRTGSAMRSSKNGCDGVGGRYGHCSALAPVQASSPGVFVLPRGASRASPGGAPTPARGVSGPLPRVVGRENTHHALGRVPGSVHCAVGDRVGAPWPASAPLRSELEGNIERAERGATGCPPRSDRRPGPGASSGSLLTMACRTTRAGPQRSCATTSQVSVTIWWFGGQSCDGVTFRVRVGGRCIHHVHRYPPRVGRPLAVRDAQRDGVQAEGERHGQQRIRAEQRFLRQPVVFEPGVAHEVAVGVGRARPIEGDRGTGR